MTAFFKKITKAMNRVDYFGVLALAAAATVATCEDSMGLGGVVDLTPPSVVVESPTPGEYVKDIVTFTGTAYDDVKVASLHISYSGIGKESLEKLESGPQKLDLDKNGRWTHDFDTRGYMDGSLKVRVKAVDGVNAATETPELVYTIKNNPPKVEINIPAVKDYTEDEKSVASGTSLIGFASDLLGVAPGWPKIQIWRERDGEDPGEAGEWSPVTEANGCSTVDQWVEGNATFSEGVKALEFRYTLDNATYTIDDVYCFRTKTVDIKGGEGIFPGDGKFIRVRITPNGLPPTIAALSNMVYAQDSLRLSANVTPPEGGDVSAVSFYLKDDRNKTNLITGAVPLGAERITLEEDIDLTALELPDGAHNFLLEALTSQDGRQEYAVTVIVDKTPPESEVTKVSPEITVSDLANPWGLTPPPEVGDTFVNGKISVMVNATDSNGLTERSGTVPEGETAEEFKWLIRKEALSTGGMNAEAKRALFESAAYVTIVNSIKSIGLDTKAEPFSGDGTYYFYLLAKDKAGNIGIKEARTLNVQQSTDAPFGTITDITLINTTAELSSLVNVLDPARIRGTLEDDDTLDAGKIVFTIWKDEAPDDKKEIKMSLGANAKSKSFDINASALGKAFDENALAIADGVYWMKIDLSDTNPDGRESAAAKTIGPFVFAVDTKPPAIEVTSYQWQKESGSDSSLSGTVSLAGTVSSLFAPVSVFVDGESATVEDKPQADGSYVWRKNIAIRNNTGGNKTLTITAKDRFDKERDPYTLEVDMTPPEVSVTQFNQVVETGSETVVKNINGVNAFTLSVMDENGVGAIRWWFLPAADSEPLWDVAGYTEITARPYTGIIDSRVFADKTDYKLWILAQDSAGNVGKLKEDDYYHALRIDQDTDKPAVVFDNLTQDDYIGEGAIVTGKITDDDGVGVAEWEYSQDGGETWSGVQPITLTGADKQKSFSIPTQGKLGADGAKALRIVVKDDPAKKMGADEGAIEGGTGAIKFTLDTIAPILDVAAPAQDNKSTYNADFTAAGSVEEQNLDAIQVKIDDEDYRKIEPVSASGVMHQWQYDIPIKDLKDGMHTIVVQAADKVGNVASRQTIFIKDKTGPEIMFSNIEVVELSAAIVEAAKKEDASEDDIKALNDIINPENGEGAPTILSDNIGGKLYITGTFSDEYSAISKNFFYRFNASSTLGEGEWVAATLSTTNKTAKFSIEISGEVKDGVNRLDVEVYDTLNNKETLKDIAFIVDRSAPGITIEEPQQNSVYGVPKNAGVLVFTARGVAIDANIKRIYVERDSLWAQIIPLETDADATFDPPKPTVGEDPAPVNWSYAVTDAQFDALPEGMNSLTVVIEDRAGFTMSATFSFVKDDTPPTVELFNIAANGSPRTVLSESSPKIQGQAGDTLGGIASVESRIETLIDHATQEWKEVEGGSSSANYEDYPKNTSFVQELDPDTFTDGAYRVSIRAKDSAGNECALEKIEFLIDRANPSLAIDPLSHAESWLVPLYQNGGADHKSFAIRGTASDANAIASVNGYIDSGAKVAAAIAVSPDGVAAWTLAFDLSSLPEGDHTIYVEAVDGAGKTSTAQKAFNFDKTAPTAAFIEPQLLAEAVELKNFVNYDDGTPANESFSGYITNPVNGAVQVRGGAADENAVARVEWQIGKNREDDGWAVFPNKIYTWDHQIDNISGYAKQDYAYCVNNGKANADDEEWLVPFNVRVTDIAGNVSVTTYGITVMPNMDKPQITIINPIDNQLLGGQLRVSGMASDDDWVYGVQVKVEPAFPGFTGAIADTGWHWATLIGSGSQVNWYYDINKSGELDPKKDNAGADLFDGNVKISVRGIDSKEHKTINLSDPPGVDNWKGEADAGVDSIEGRDATVNVTFDSTMPIISDIRITGGGGGNLDVEYTEGLRVSKTVTVSATIRDAYDDNRGGLISVKWRVSSGTVELFNTPEVVLAQSGESVKINGENVTIGENGAAKINGIEYIIYTLTRTIDTMPLYPDSSGLYAITLVAQDTTTPIPCQAQTTLNIGVDNFYPQKVSFTSGAGESPVRLVGTNVQIQGVVTDYITGKGNISGLEKVVAYFQRKESNGAPGAYIGIQGQPLQGQPLAGVKEEGVGVDTTLQNFPPLLANGAIDEEYALVIDETLPDNGETWLPAGQNQTWAKKFDTTKLADGPYLLHYVIFDVAGNKSHYTEDIYIENNKPAILSVTLGTDLNADGAIKEGARFDLIGGNLVSGEYNQYSTNYGTTRFTVRNKRLSIAVNATKGNGTLNYHVYYDTNNNGVIDAGDTNLDSHLSGDTLNLTDFAGIGDTMDNGAKFIIKVYDTTVAGGVEDEQLSDTIVIGMNIDNEDETASSIAVALFGEKFEANADPSLMKAIDVADYNENVVTETTGIGARAVAERFGHVEYAGGLPPSNNAIISGRVVFLGKASDDQRLTYITAAIPGYKGGAEFVIAKWDEKTSTLVAVDDDHIWEKAATAEWAFEVEANSNSITQAHGHTLTWRFAWDSSRIAGVVGEGKAVAFKAYDAGPTYNAAAPSGGNASLKADITVDIAPYITGIERDSLYGATLRSKLGWYSFVRSERVAVKGFNLSSGADATVSFGGKDVTTISAQGADEVTVTVPDTAASGAILLKAGGIEAVNNRNDNAKAWNQDYSAKTEGSDLWPDDRYAHIWISNDSVSGDTRGRFDQSDRPMHPSMTIDPATGVLYGAWSNYITATTYWAPNNGSIYYTTSTSRPGIWKDTDPSEHTDIYFANGRMQPSIVYQANVFSNGDKHKLSSWGGVYLWDEKADVLRGGASELPQGTTSDYANSYRSNNSSAYKGYVAESFLHDGIIGQFPNPRIVASGDKIFISYYDADTKSLKYWYHNSGTLTIDSKSVHNVPGPTYTEGSAITLDTKEIPNRRWVNIAGGFDGHDVIGGNAGERVVGYQSYSDINNVELDLKGWFEESTYKVKYAIDTVNDKYTNGDVNAYNRTGFSASTNAGEYSAIDLTSDGRPVIVYYDAQQATLRLAYSSAGDVDSLNADNWTIQEVMNSGDPNRQFAGKYVSMRIDSSNNIHIAFYRNNTGELIYIKGTPSGAGFAFIEPSKIIDSVGSVGKWADVSLDAEGNPWISYQDASRVDSANGLKMAFYDSDRKNPLDGASYTDDNGEDITGWEAVTVGLDARFAVADSRTNIENRPQSVNATTLGWESAIGYASDDYFRIAYYIKEE